MFLGNLRIQGCGVLLVIAGVLISTLHINTFYYSYDAPKWSVFDICLSVSLFLLAFQNRIKLFQLGIAGLINFAILTFMLASIFWAANPYSASEWFIRYALASTLIISLITTYSHEKLTTLILNIIVWSAFAFCVVMLIERYVFSLPRNVGAFSPIGFQNNSGQVFNIWIPVLTYLSLKHIKKPIAFFYLFVLFIVILSLVEAATRGSVLGLFLGEILIFLLLVRKERKLALRFLSITTLVVSALALSQHVDFLRSEQLAAKLSRLTSGISASSGQRIAMFHNTWQMTLDNPIGVGTNNFEYIHPKYARVGDKKNFSPFVNDKQILRTPHNYPLKVFSEIGIVGGLLTLLLYLVVFVRGVQNALRGDFLDKWLLVALVALSFHSLVSGLFLNPASLFFSTLLITLILKRGTSTEKPYLSFSARNLLLLQVMLVPILSTIWLSSHACAYQGRKFGDVDRLQQALVLNPGNERAWYDLAKLQYQKYRDLEGSLDSISRFIELYPYHINALYIKAQREYSLGKLHQSNYTIDRLLKIYPSYKPAKTLRQQVRRSLTLHLSQSRENFKY